MEEKFPQLFSKKAITTAISGLKPFPENIFIEEQNWLNEHFLPLISIDLGLIQTNLNGIVVHMISPFEPFDGLIGEYTKEYHNEFVTTNWLAFELTKDNKYKFLNSEEYFYFAKQHNKEINREHQTFVDKNKFAFQVIKKRFLNTGYLIADEDYPEFKMNFLSNLGGRVWNGNWIDTAPIPPAFELIEQDERARTIIDLYDDLDDIEQNLNDDFYLENTDQEIITAQKEEKIRLMRAIIEEKSKLDKLEAINDSTLIKYKGEEFLFVGDVAGYNYLDTGADAILMFYEPKSRVVLFTFDWT